MTKYTVIFAGTPDMACPALLALINDHRFEVKAVISQIDKPIGRQQIITPPPVKQVAEKFSIPVWQPLKIKEITHQLQKLAPDFLVVIAYGQILPPAILQIAKWNINLHGSILPKYRGASPIQTALLNGDTETGISIMNIEAKMDTGAVYKTHILPIAITDNTETLFNKIANLGQCLPNDLYDIAQGLVSIPQNEQLASYCHKIRTEDGKINWSKNSASTILNQVRAFNPWPGAFFYWQSQRIKLLSAQVLNKNELDNLSEPELKILEPPLVIFNYQNKKHYAFKIDQDYFIPGQIVPAGKKVVDFQVWIRNYYS